MSGFSIFPIVPARPAVLPGLAIVAATAFTSLACTVFALIAGVA